MPGCVVCFGNSEAIVYLEAFGNRQEQPTKIAMTVDTLFDLASLTKPIATATSVMMLVEQGTLSTRSEASKYVPEFASKGKNSIRIFDLLTHQSGLIPDNPLSDYLEGPEVAWGKICNLQLSSPVRSKFQYSDVNFIVLGEIVERVTGNSLAEFAGKHLFDPLGMQETGFVLSPELKLRAAPSEKRNNVWIQGDVHDPRAFALGGVAGHAGLFSTAVDLSKFAQALLLVHPEGSPSRKGKIALSAQTLSEMTADYSVGNGIRGLGWDKKSAYSSNRGELLSPSAFGHGGFTGTVLWIDPEQNLFFVFLSNRLHPDGKGSVNQLASRITDILVAAIKP